MTLKDWISDSVQRYRERPFAEATARSMREFAVGASRRTVDPHLGSAWWGRDDWDVLVVMDACRVDLAREALDEPVGTAVSNASTSIDWIERHFANGHRRHWQDTAYVTANPFADHDADHAKSAELAAKPLGAFEPVYEDAWTREPVGTTPPRAVTERALETWRTADVDRMVVHYMQPHQPFRARPEWESVYSNMEDLATDINRGGPDIWRQVRNGVVDRADAWEAYADNLRWVWAEAHNGLVAGLEDERVLFTSDHGNMLGELGGWGHRGGMLHPAVRVVPVLGPYTEPIDVADRGADTESASAAAAERLEALGYR